jgi:diguanylate cyclase (GGDEF)-like protein
MTTTLALDGNDLRVSGTTVLAAGDVMVRVRRGVLCCAWLLVALGVLVLLGWQLDYAPLMSVLPGRVSMKPNTALCFMAAGLGLAARTRAARTGGAASRWLASAVIAVGALTLAEYLFHVNLGVDQCFFPDPAPSMYPGRMAALSAMNFIACGVALYLAGGDAQARRQARGIVLGVGVAALAAIVGGVYGVEIFYGSLGHTAMALHTGIGFLVLSAGIGFVDTDSSLMRMLCAPEDGGTLFRRALPGVVLAPLALGWLYLQPSVNFGRPRFGMALLAVTLACAGTSALWYAADFLTRAQRHREEAESALWHREILERANRMLQQRASTDGLTGLKNRGEFERRLREAFDLASCSGCSLAALMIDVDNFKQCNDTRGHAAGDRVLQTLAAILSECVREPDVAARYGGEEFAVLLPGGDLAGARLVAERIRTMIAATIWTDGPVTVSIGMGSRTVGMMQADELIRAADDALYRAKRGGKNCVR